MSLQTSSAVRFGGFLLDRSAGGLFRLDASGNPVSLPIGSRAVDVLGILVERRGDLVSKQAIMDAVWPGTAVEENNLTVQISTLRRVLDAGRRDGSCIQKVSGRGYRFVIPLNPQDGASAPLPVGPIDGGGNDDLPEAISDVTVVAPDAATPTRLVRQHRRIPAAVLLTGFGVVIGALLLLGLGHAPWLTGGQFRRGCLSSCCRSKTSATTRTTTWPTALPTI